jgi:glycosyltransferase involved in cell wall biosynthesis
MKETSAVASLGQPFDRSVSLLAWGYNEESLIEDFLKRAVELMESTVNDFEVVFVNDGSSDRTGELAEAFAKRDPRVTVLHNSTNLNVGYSCRRAIQAAAKEYLFWQTVDWSYDISNVRSYLELLKHYDVVQGARVEIKSPLDFAILAFSAGSRSDNYKKAFVSIANYLLVRTLFGVPLSDYQNVTFYAAAHLKALPLEGRSSFVNPEMLIRSYYLGLKFVEVPIPFIRRTKGKAKGTRLTSIASSLRDIFSAWMRWGLSLRLRTAGGTHPISRFGRKEWLPASVSAILAPTSNGEAPVGTTTTGTSAKPKRKDLGADLPSA